VIEYQTVAVTVSSHGLAGSVLTVVAASVVRVVVLAISKKLMLTNGPFDSRRKFTTQAVD